MVLRLTKVEKTTQQVSAGVLFTGYTVEGVIGKLPEPGECLKMLRYARNGIRACGWFQTSPVKKIEGDKIYTQNSIWQFEEIPNPVPV